MFLSYITIYNGIWRNSHVEDGGNVPGEEWEKSILVKHVQAVARIQKRVKEKIKEDERKSYMFA